MIKFVLLVSLLVASSALADESKFSREDLLDCENVGLKIEKLERQAQDLAAHRDEVVKKYGVAWADYGRSWSVTADGAIHRAPKPEEKKPADAKAPPAPAKPASKK